MVRSREGSEAIEFLKVSPVPLCEVKTLLTHPSVVLRRFLRDKPRKLVMFAVGDLCGQAFVCFKHTVEVGMTVLMERVFFHVVDGKPVQPDRPPLGEFLRLLSPFSQQFKRLVVSIPAWSFDRYVESYHGRRRSLAKRAVASVLTGGVARKVPYWARVNAFIKHEKLPVTPNKKLVPRMIQPRKPEYNALLGRYIRPAEPYIFHLLQKMTNSITPVVGKGVDTIQLGKIVETKWRQFKRPVGIGFDQSRFDQHISNGALQFEHGLYDQIFHSAELRDLLREQLVTHGNLLCDDGRLKYSTDGGRCSGDMNTSLGNSLLQFAMIYSYASSHSVPSYEVLVNGDDSFIITEAEHVGAWSGLGAFCKELGFMLTVEKPVHVLEKLSFCQMQPVYVPSIGYIMTRNCPNCVSKDLHTTQSLTPERYFRYLAGIGVAGTALCPGIPVCQAFYEMLASLDVPLEREEMFGAGWLQWVRSLLPRHLEVAPETRYSFYLAFGMLPDMQIALEQRFASLHKTDFVYERQAGGPSL